MSPLNTLNGATMPTSKKTASKKPAKKIAKKPAAATKQKTPQVTPLPPPQTVTLPSVTVKTEAQKIWDEIKDLPIQMFGLPGQTVAMHVTPVMVEPTKLYVVTRSSATLPSLEETIKGAFAVELADKFVIITRLPLPVVPRNR